jgi:hypothetical protein
MGRQELISDDPLRNRIQLGNGGKQTVVFVDRCHLLEEIDPSGWQCIAKQGTIAAGIR